MNAMGTSANKFKGKGLIAAAFGLFLKAGKILKALKLLKFGKILVTFFSMAISAFVYAFWLGPWFAVGFTLLLFVHEMGHVLAMKMKGMPTKAPVFIPMLGAVIFAPPFQSREEESFVGYGGPLIGSIAAVALFGVWWLLPQRPEIILLLSFTGIFLNLFNLIPVSPLDGGRVTQSIGEWFKYVGLLCLFAFTLYARQPSMLLIWIFILSDSKFNWPLKFGIGLLCWASMTALMLAGFSGQKWYIDLLDVILAGLVVGLFWWRWGIEKKLKELGQTASEELSLPPVPFGVRLKWLALYLLLMGALIFVIVLESPYLPHHATR
ncbi:site-2 protease family protein [Candidatus Uhrbacteria bacterium]|nr:site-2 protease family protein [Candidatus Uhrbacteria bacterium]